MSTQSAQSILFTQRSPQQGLKLLELPPELAELLSSKEAPTLELKSPSPSVLRSTAEPDAREYVNLCTPTQTYRIRQVQSSNSIHILQPSDGGIQRGDINMVGNDSEMNLVETMTSIAKCGSTLELHVPPEGFSATPFLQKTLKLYNRLSSDGDMDVDMDAGSADLDPEVRRKCIEDYFADIPVSRAQCDKAWAELCGFVFRDTGTDHVACWQPSPKVKLDIWKRMVDGAVLQGIDLEKQFLATDLWRSLLDESSEEPFPRPLFEAVLRKICEPEDGQDQVSAVSNVKWASLDKANCTRWVGETYLEAMAPTPGSAIGRSEFLNAWKDHLPEPWRNEVSLSKLTDGMYKHPDPTTICFMDNLERAKTKKNLPSEPGIAAKKTRNWHELFKNQKRR